MTSAPFLPVGDQPLLGKAAPANQQMARLLDALLILQAEGSAPVADLAVRVGLPPDRLRDLLSSYMVAAADAVGTSAPFTLTFGTADGPLGTGPEDDDAQASADVVHLSRLGSARLLDDVGRRAVSVEDVARGLLSARALLVADGLEPRHRLMVEALVRTLEQAMAITVTAPLDAVADRVRSAVQERRTVRFRYRDPWTGVESWPEVEPYDVRRRRDRVVLDAGVPGQPHRTYDVSSIAELEVGEPGSFVPPSLPPADRRDEPVRVLLRVPFDSAAERRLYDGWSGRVRRRVGADVDVEVLLDRSDAPGRLGVLLLQLGPPCSVVEPAELCDAAVPVARRLLEALPQQ